MGRCRGSHWPSLSTVVISLGRTGTSALDLAGYILKLRQLLFLTACAEQKGVEDVAGVSTSESGHLIPEDSGCLLLCFSCFVSC